MKSFFLFGFLMIANFTMAQTKGDPEPGYVIKGLKIDRIKEREAKIQSFVDSLNRYDGGQLPNFLFDPCLDWNSFYWENLHSPLSVRWTILKRSTNKKSLKLIMENGGKKLNAICDKEPAPGYPHLVVPMSKKSFRQLIKDRYKEL